MTLVELMVATGVGSVVLAAVMALSLFSARSFAALGNYVDLDIKSRTALDQMSSDIRQADKLTAATTNSLTFQTTDPNTSNTVSLVYNYSPSAQTLTRTYNGQTTTNLIGCTFLQFSIFQRNPIGYKYEQYDAADASTCKLVQLTWVCQRSILGRIANTESVQSAKVVMRKP